MFGVPNESKVRFLALVIKKHYHNLAVSLNNVILLEIFYVNHYEI